ncbi:MAG: siroheme synthase CysG [Gammaproteobacteria bacterium]|jgi:uroporphyrin-III C-methyltransferase / precorrin-2 dehydrogenase / sirohydrochlorin ferrochelatase|nr:siroheme synthase CysG [Gammaproteobacteria bacterium]
MDYLPLFYKVKNRQVLLVGGGKVALRKANFLLRAQAKIKLVAIEVCAELEELLADKKHEVSSRAFQNGDINEASLIVAATNNIELNKQIADAAAKLNIPVNVVDQPELCSFIFPSIVDRSPLIVAVSSSGKSPVLARLLRSRLETFIPSGYGTLSVFLGDFRNKVKSKINSLSARMRFWEKVINGPAAELLLAGKPEQAETIVESMLSDFDEKELSQGEVYLVGAGPGDPDLLTFRALRLMQQADVVLYDRLVSQEILYMTRQDADKIHVGKQREKHTMEQGEISSLLVKLAKSGKRVLRLKGGDPFIFGRGGEEIEQLAEANIPFQVVPGITAASGCSSYAGIPLTHRDYAQSVTFVTGHMKNNQCDLNWSHLVQEGQTVVIYMGLIGLPYICEQLIIHGRPGDTPIALIQKGTTPQQKIYIGTLDTLPEIIREKDVQAPTLIIVGEVVALHEKLSW